MGTTHQLHLKPSTPTEVRDRGNALLQRLRRAGIWQYNRWFLDKEPKWVGDAALQSRITMLLNGRGAMSDSQLLMKCETLASRFLGGNKSAA